MDQETVFNLHGYEIDLDKLYRAMYDQAEHIDGELVFNGNRPTVRAVKRLLNDLFAVPVLDRIHPVNDDIRSECRDRLAALGWARKDVGRSARYVLLRQLPLDSPERSLAEWSEWLPFSRACTEAPQRPGPTPGSWTRGVITQRLAA